MSESNDYPDPEVARAQIDAMRGPSVVEFGAPWCGICRAARPAVDAAFAGYPGVPHLRIEDGKGRRLGRTFSVKLWPTLIFLKDGVEVGRVVRPANAEEVSAELAKISAS